MASMNGKYSQENRAGAEVPQDSILGPIVFLLYIDNFMTETPII